MHKYYNLFIYRMPGTDPKAFPCILCNNNTKKKKNKNEGPLTNLCQNT